MPKLHPLRFRPLFRQYLWGGRRLGTELNKAIGEGDDYAESWEVVDHGEDQSVVDAGPLAGTSLHELVTQQGEALFGQHHPQPQFPLLLKFLDANRKLSLQVHPDDAMAAKQDPPDLGKTEAWVVMDAEPGSVIYAGLKRGFDRPAVERELERGTLELCVHKFEPNKGDCIFLPAGVVHAIGAGLLIAELQQASDTTFRLYDWNRVGADGKPRELHVEQGLNATDWDYGPASPQTPQPTDRDHVERLVACEKFVIDRWKFSSKETAGGDNKLHIVAVLEGEAQVEGDPSGEPLVRGQTMLLPAEIGSVAIEPSDECTLLDMYLP